MMGTWPRWPLLGCLLLSLTLATGCGGGRETGQAPKKYDPEKTESGEAGAIPKEFQDEAGVQ